MTMASLMHLKEPIPSALWTMYLSFCRATLVPNTWPTTSSTCAHRHRLANGLIQSVHWSLRRRSQSSFKDHQLEIFTQVAGNFWDLLIYICHRCLDNAFVAHLYQRPSCVYSVNNKSLLYAISIVWGSKSEFEVCLSAYVHRNICCHSAQRPTITNSLLSCS